MKLVRLTAYAVLGASSAFAATAMAGVITRTEYRHASETCQPAREYPNARIRTDKIDNIGSGNVYVACGLGVMQGSTGTKTVLVYLNNDSDAPVEISCTMRNTYAGLVTGMNSTKSTTVSAGSIGSLVWTGADFGETVLTYPGIQCVLPEDTGVSLIGFNYDEEIGS